MAREGEVIAGEVIVEEQGGTPRAPWGPWETVFLGLPVVGLFLIVQVVVVIVFGVVEMVFDQDADLEKLLRGLETEGDVISVSTCLTAALCTGLILLLVMLRKGPDVRSYLALRKVGAGVFFRWLGVTFLFMGLSDSLRVLQERPIVPEVMASVYQSADFLPLLWIALIVAAPVFEEMFFRGFLFRGFLGSRLGSLGTIVVTSLLWTVIHIQYDFYDMASIFVIGLLLGLARLRSRSLYVPIAMHAVNNLVAAVETGWHVRFLAGG